MPDWTRRKPLSHNKRSTEGEAMTEDVRDAAALERAKLWQALGYPAVPDTMDDEHYYRAYKSRTRCKNRTVFEQVSKILRTIFCPSCVQDDSTTDAIVCSRLFITIENDVMTVFPAVGHFTCHHCGWEEYHPMARDPRMDNLAAAARDYGYHQNQLGILGMGAMNAGGLPDPMQQSIGAVGRHMHGTAQSSVARGLGSAIPGMLTEEYDAMLRLYHDATKRTSTVQGRANIKAQLEALKRKV